MTQHYSDPTRASDPYALPDIEVFYLNQREAEDFEVYDDEYLTAGWYYWYCFPGCIPSSDPIGPFNSEAEALEEARS